MPPKKDKEKKLVLPPPPPIEVLTDKDRRFYLVQIKDLETRLAKYQRKCDELEVENTDLTAKLAQLKLDQRDITTFLKRTIEQRGDELQEMEEQIGNITTNQEKMKEDYDQQLVELKQQFSQVKDQMTDENLTLANKLVVLEEFRLMKDDLLTRYSKMEIQLVQQQENHEEVIFQLRKKACIDKSKLQQEIVERINNIAVEVRETSKREMAETTKRVIQENVMITTQLNKLSDRIAQLIQENDQYNTKNKQQKLRIDMLENNEQLLTVQNQSNLKVIRMLTNKYKTQQKNLDNAEGIEKIALLETTKAQLQGELYNVMDNYRETEKTLKKKINEVITLDNLVHIQSQDLHKLEKVLVEAAYALKDLIIHQEDKTLSEANLLAKRNSMLQSLLNILNMAATKGVGPVPADMATDQKILAEESAAEEQRLPPLSKSNKRISVPYPHYQLGNLGFIPRPMTYIPTHSIPKVLSGKSSRRSARNVLNYNIGLQTSSIPSIPELAMALRIMGESKQNNYGIPISPNPT